MARVATCESELASREIGLRTEARAECHPIESDRDRRRSRSLQFEAVRAEEIVAFEPEGFVEGVGGLVVGAGLEG